MRRAAPAVGLRQVRPRATTVYRRYLLHWQTDATLRSGAPNHAHGRSPAYFRPAPPASDSQAAERWQPEAARWNAPAGREIAIALDRRFPALGARWDTSVSLAVATFRDQMAVHQKQKLSHKSFCPNDEQWEQTPKSLQKSKPHPGQSPCEASALRSFSRTEPLHIGTRGVTTRVR